jgi:hypothetical protein
LKCQKASGDAHVDYHGTRAPRHAVNW